MQTDRTARFWARVDRAGPTIRPDLGSCWEWTGSRVNGYGSVWDWEEQRTTHAQRLAYKLTFGPFGRALHVLHRCDNPPCVRPDHLFLGTAKDNGLDAKAKRRHPSGARHWTAQRPVTTIGSRHGNAKLTEEAVTEIRRLLAAGGRPRDIAPPFGISQQNVTNIKHGRTWRHL